MIRRGKLVAFPTETVYGLGADALNEEAVKSIYAAKGRPSDNPMIVHIAAREQLYDLIEGGSDGISQDALKLMDAFWPGPLTIIFKKSAAVPAATTGGLDTVAVRMPSNETARQLITAAGRAIAAPSANKSGKPSPTNAVDVLEDMDDRIDGLIMGEQCEVGIESTVVDMTGEVPTVLRPGKITAEVLYSVLGKEVVYDKSLTTKPSKIADPSDGVAETENAPKSPGMKYKHYSPNAKVRLIEGSDEVFMAKALELGREAMNNGEKAAILNYGDDPDKAARQLFTDLRELDRQGYDQIYIRSLEEMGFGFSVMNRMLKSAGYDIIKEHEDKMIIAIGCDHAGYELKEKVKARMESAGHKMIDVGTDSTESVDYPKYGHAVGRTVASGEAERGIAICGSGIGISIACNKVPGIRAALCTSVEMAEMCRRHNNANVICMGARMIEEELAYAMIDTWMTTEFEGGKHERRINELDDINF